MERKLCTIQTISDLNPINGADKIEVASVLGWKVVVQKGLYNINDKVVYCEVDSLPPQKPEFEFLKDRGYRIKTIRLRKQISQGIIFPLSILPQGDYNVGDDVTQIMGVTKWEPIIPENLSGEMWGKKPWFVPTTDEIRIQSYPELIDEIKGKQVYQSVKCDGTSCSIYFNSNFDREFGVCSRNMELKEGDTAYWKVAKKYNLQEKLKKYGKTIVLQGECCGPSIQKNRLGLKELDWFMFDVYLPEEQRYASLNEMLDIAKLLDIKTVPIECVYDSFNFDLEGLLKLAEGKYSGTLNNREGNVWRPLDPTYSKTLDGRLSFKVLNNEFLMKDEE